MRKMQAHLARVQVEQLIKNRQLRIIVKPNHNTNTILGIEEGIVKVGVKAPPDKNKANKEVIKFFSKVLKRKVRIKSGLSSKEKVLVIG